MRRALRWFWKTGMLSTYLAGLFAVFPIVIYGSDSAFARQPRQPERPDRCESVMQVFLLLEARRYAYRQ